jgi:hypothetical protein
VLDDYWAGGRERGLLAIVRKYIRMGELAKPQEVLFDGIQIPNYVVEGFDINADADESTREVIAWTVRTAIKLSGHMWDLGDFLKPSWMRPIEVAQPQLTNDVRRSIDMLINEFVPKGSEALKIGDAMFELLHLDKASKGAGRQRVA